MRLAIEKACPAQVAHFIAIATGNTRQYILYIGMATRFWEGHILVLTVGGRGRLVNLMTCKVGAPTEVYLSKLRPSDYEFFSIF